MSDTPSVDPAAPATESSALDHGGRGRFWALALGSVGVVFGDIGTSPLYAFKESIAHLGEETGRAVSRSEVIGVISLMIWTLMIIVTFKYVLLLLRMSNRGEGGTMSLMALVQGAVGRRTAFLFIVAICSAGLFLGDALLTPAVSVLSAIEGLTVIPSLQGRIEPFIIPLTLLLIAGLFLLQRRGTHVVGALFGPVCLVWFLVLAGLGVANIVRDPGIFLAISPHLALGFLFSHGLIAFVVLGSVFLTVTGAEALYADMGHFGRRPIAATWLWLVYPCLILNYLGQGAEVLADPSAAANPFFLMAPEALQLPLVVLAAMATIIASQAVISGAYSLAQQAMQLGLLPRMRIQKTSAVHAGQIYIPSINWLLLGGVVALVLLFRSSSALASAYGVSVIGAMITSTVLFFVAVRRVWKRSLTTAVLVVGPILLVEGVFLIANLAKIPSGGYAPLLIAAAAMLVMWTWATGSATLVRRTAHTMSVQEVFAALPRADVAKARGTAIFLTSDPAAAPSALLHNIKHNKVVHERNIFLTVQTEDSPRVAEEAKVSVEPVGENLTRVIARFGFMETPDVPKALRLARAKGLDVEMATASFFLSRHIVLPDARIGMPVWQDRLFIFLHRNSMRAVEFFRIPNPRRRIGQPGDRLTRPPRRLALRDARRHATPLAGRLKLQWTADENPARRYRRQHL